MSESETASTTPATTSGAGASTEPMAVPLLPEDWDRQATERVIGLVDQVKVATSGRAIVVARAAVYGFLAAVFGLILLVLVLILLTRLVSNLVGVWLAYMIIGALCCALGGFAWSKRPKGALD